MPPIGPSQCHVPIHHSVLLEKSLASHGQRRLAAFTNSPSVNDKKLETLFSVLKLFVYENYIFRRARIGSPRKPPPRDLRLVRWLSNLSW
ncbi:hypothetical protein K227x_15890 [Rubripirellula lacrimiformis]|uniref:Uncharacterized protein n=1 Tax=Rubripirellula lacrimiformis TaxID=1930273 RepID=A0A517N7U3_9BACT|nr:hypothetical protein K227x_15890 [Rubripirellula lacrimiformis]